MPCEYKLKGYCFHPERAGKEVLAINCAYNWLLEGKSKIVKD